ncbi:MAG: beta-ribofuranosylaminobenzene 5'-phosphate synthase, partial [Planctomycetota bacterium]
MKQENPIRIVTGARLHFGLIDVSPPFGGCGVMLQSPATIIQTTSSDRWTEWGEAHTAAHQRRLQAIRQRIACQHDLSPSLPVSLEVVSASSPHQGLGSGTQFDLAASEAILQRLKTDGHFESGCADNTVLDSEIIQAADRGRRSLVGTHGYFRGGFIAEGLTTRTDGCLNQIDAQLPLPPSWRVAICLPDRPPGSSGELVSGDAERSAFQRLPPVSSQTRDQLIQQVIDELIPAIKHERYDQFCDAVFQFNRRSGDLFRDVQGGPYNGDQITDVVRRLHA